MIIFGPYKALKDALHDGKKKSVYNINSPVPVGYDIKNIFPQVVEGIYPGEQSYDMYLANYLVNDTDQTGFNCMMNILYSDYTGLDTYVLVDNSWWSMIYIESLIKFIQYRYGCNINIVNTPEDLQYCKETLFSMNGRQQFQCDKEKFVYINFDKFMENEDTVEG